MKRMLFVGFCVAALAARADADSLSVNSDKLTYLVGETVTLTVTGDDGGASAYVIFGRLEYSGALVDNGTRSQTLLVGERFRWSRTSLDQADDGTNAYSVAFNQVAEVPAQTALNLPGTLSIVTLIAEAVGVVNVAWNTNLASGFQLRFFGLTDAPGTSFTIVPEPATAALLALGVVALAAARRSRGCS